jgi:hypothetical protein
MAAGLKLTRQRSHRIKVAWYVNTDKPSFIN